jgi:hypothetical protein
VPSTYRSTAAISRNAPFQLLQSMAVPQAIKLHPSRGAPNDVDVLSRSRRSICYAHVMIAVAARLRLISPIPSLVNRRGNILHTVDVNTTWYVHREVGAISTLTCCPSKASAHATSSTALVQVRPPIPPLHVPSLKVSRQRSHPYM